MYDDLIYRLNRYSREHENHGGITSEAADVIQELCRELDMFGASLEKANIMLRQYREREDERQALNPIKYEYHYDHTDCIWYRPEARNRCPTTCAQYRDGWNDAMNYIFRDGKGYRPYRRDEKYEE